MKKEKLTTPVGEAKWAHVQKPKDPYTDDKGRTQGESKYQIDVVFPANDPAWKDWGGKIMAQIKALPIQKNKATGVDLPHQIPIKKEFDENDQPTGRFYVTFKTGAAYKPNLFDKFGQLLPETVLVGNGSKVRVNYCENIYDAFGGGMNFYLNAVQVLELVEFKPATAEGYGFQVEKLSDAFPEVAVTPAQPVSPSNAACDNTGRVDDSDVPF
jgi:hypothetical protein